MHAVRRRIGLRARAAHWASLLRDRRGISAVEFALIAPILILLYVGVVEIGNALTVYRRTSTVAATAADLTAQVKKITGPEIQDIFSASTGILDPFPTTPLRIVLSSVVADNNNNGKVAWSCANKGSGRAVNSGFSVPPGLTEANTSVIVAEITYSFAPLLNLTSIFSPGAFDMTRTFYARPRRSATVAKTDGISCS
jgi:Flp pilus assembly protein TadG